MNAERARTETDEENQPLVMNERLGWQWLCADFRDRVRSLHTPPRYPKLAEDDPE